MTQAATMLIRWGALKLEIPPPNAMLMKSIRWGSIDAFPTPAYWLYQIVARRLASRPVNYKLGRTLAEEVGACLLGGHGIPSTIGIAAYEKLRKLGAFEKPGQSIEQLERWLKEPIQIGNRQVHYRFATQKARYLGESISQAQSAPKFEAGRQLRDWLLQLPGVGLKTASWIARNWMDADDVAILDIHIMRVFQLIGLFPRELTVERHYIELEQLFLQFSAALGVRPAELDAIVWYEMASSPALIRFVTMELSNSSDSARNGVAHPRMRKRGHKDNSTSHGTPNAANPAA